MEKLIYKTGRIYDSEQVLEIEVQKSVEDEFGMRDIVATFTDASRRISGRVEIVVFDPSDIGKAVLSSYDSGNYATL